MNDNPLYNGWREIGWRRKLTAEEEAQLAEFLNAHPEAHADWESEAALNELLGSLPSVPVASNFTARVLAAAEREASGSAPSQERTAHAVPWWKRWVPKTAFAAVVLAGLVSYHHIQSVERTERAQSLATLSEAEPIPSPDVLNDYDAIAALSSTPPADEELLRIMQ